MAVICSRADGWEVRASRTLADPTTTVCKTTTVFNMMPSVCGLA
jgi:hypothetical protein